MEEKDYKKLYEDVLERAKNGLKDKNYYLSQSAKEVTEFLFPQLKETEDEKVRRELTRFLINFNNGYYSKPSETEIDSWVKWIDKKCGQKPADKVEPKFKVGDWIVKQYLSYPFVIVDIKNDSYILNDIEGNKYEETIDFANRVFHLWTIEDANDGDVLAAHECLVLFKKIDGLNIRCYCTYHFMNNQSFYVDTLQNKDAFHSATKEQCDLLFQKMKEAGYEWNDEKKELKNIEQKPTDKVEPKFKVGDWITNGGLLVGQVTSFDGEYYHYMCEGIEQPLHISNAYNWHLWAIQDAKDGDVLFTSSTASHETFIFKSIDEKGNAECYFAYDSEDGFREGKYHFIGSAINCKPATKEQRDLLFQKMREAGYEWDDEKKELKKIEQKPVDKIESKFKVGDSIRYKNSGAIFTIKSVFSDHYSLTNNEGLLYFKFQDKYELVEQKPSWSEEDEKKWSQVINEIEAIKSNSSTIFEKNVAQDKIDWLKSIKDRVHPQPKQEWSEEDEKKRKGLIKGLEDKMGFGWASDPFSREEYIDWLKSIKEKIQRLA